MQNKSGSFEEDPLFAPNQTEKAGAGDRFRLAFSKSIRYNDINYTYAQAAVCAAGTLKFLTGGAMTQNCFNRIICILLAWILSLQCLALPARATQTEETAVTEVTEVTVETQAAEETQPQQTEPEETQPPETEPPETEPEETQPPETEPEDDWRDELPSYLQVPLYIQNDYPETMYGSGSVATAGCSITCLAMVATYMTGHEYLPDELARYFGGRAENSIKRLEIGSDTLKLAYHKAENIHETMDALREGKVAIALMRKGSLFTNTQHFIVLAGLTEDGKIMVHEPYEPNYDVWNLKKGLRYGFEEDDILKGYDGAWIYDKSAMPDDPFIYSEPEIDKSKTRYTDIKLTLEETKLLARVIWCEARGESPEGQQAVAEVVFNRMKSDNYANSLSGVIYAAGQFRTVPFLEDAEPFQMQYDAIERALYGPYVLPEEVMHFATFKTNPYVWGRIGRHIFCYDWENGQSIDVTN